MATRPTRDIVVIGASAGGVEALTELCRGLPAELPAAVFVAVHTSPISPGVLPRVLQRYCRLPIANAVHGDAVAAGRVYVAPPDYHLLLSPGVVRLTRGPRENGFRPAVDPLFRTAARAYGPRVVGIILSGGLDDGTEGLALVKHLGGVAIAQEPSEAACPSMPASAAENVNVDYILPVAEMPAVLARLASEPLPKGVKPMAPDPNDPPEAAEGVQDTLETGALRGAPTPLTCPECNGALWELRKGKLVRYRCHVGHNYTADGLMAAKVEDLEAVLWSAMRALEENADLRRRMARRASQGHYQAIVRQYEQQAAEAEERAEAIRAVLMDSAGRMTSTWRR